MQELRTNRRVLLGVGSAVAATSALGILDGRPASATTHRNGPADLVIMNGKVLTMDRCANPAQALAIRNGVVLAIGNNREIQRLAGRGTQFIDAAGGTVLPGINDSHLHLGGFALSLPPLSYNVDRLTVAEIAAAVEAAEPGAWVQGSGWNGNVLDRLPERQYIDPVSPNNPVLLGDFSFHAAAVNTAGLELVRRHYGLASINDIPSLATTLGLPDNARFEVDAHGAPTGILREAASWVVRAIVPAATTEQVSKGIDSSIAALHSLGITSITEPGIGPTQLRLYEEKARAGALPIRLTAMLTGGSSVAALREILAAYRPATGVDARNLTVQAIKLMADGVPTEARTAYLNEPYLGMGDYRGALAIAGATVKEQIAELHALIATAVKAGFQVGTHATGDGAIDAVVDGYVKAMDRTWRRTDLRHYVIHGDLASARTLRTMARYDIGANMNATIKYLLGQTLYPVLGEERTNYQWPYRTALDLGVRVSSSSDAPVTPPSWLQGVQGAILREGQFGGVAGEAERITLAEALRTYTYAPAVQDRAERWKGRLGKGMVADVAILDRDIFSVHPRELITLEVVATVLGGRPVYDVTSTGGRQARAGATAAAGWSHSHGRSCLSQGLCCCRLIEQRRSKRV